MTYITGMVQRSDASFDDAFRRDLVALIPVTRGIARSICSGDAAAGDDLAQDAVAKAWQARRSFAPGTNMKAWISRILRNQFYSDKRRSWRSTQLDPEVAERTLVASDDPQAALDLNSLRQALAMLPLAQREALILIGVAGLDYEAVAGICNCPVGTVKSRVSRARAALSQTLERGEFTRDAAPAGEAMGALFHEADTLRSGAAQ